MKKFFFKLDSFLEYQNYKKSLVENDLTKEVSNYKKKYLEFKKMQDLLNQKIIDDKKFFEKNISKNHLLAKEDYFLLQREISKKSQETLTPIKENIDQLKKKWMEIYKKTYVIKTYRERQYRDYIKKLEAEEDQELGEIFLAQKIKIKGELL